jgi:hypothetical protein
MQEEIAYSYVEGTEPGYVSITYWAEFFGSKVDWKIGTRWKYLNELDFSINAVKGHLPRLFNGDGALNIFLLQHFRSCKSKIN